MGITRGGPRLPPASSMICPMWGFILEVAMPSKGLRKPRATNSRWLRQAHGKISYWFTPILAYGELKIYPLVTKSQCSQQNSYISIDQQILNNMSNRTKTKLTSKAQITTIFLTG